MTIQQYLESVAKRYALGNSTEHTFRGDLQQLIETLQPEIQATNEPKRIECGAPKRSFGLQLCCSMCGEALLCR